MNVIATIGRDDIAVVYIAKNKNGRLIEFVESLQPPLSIEEKWVIIVSTLYGCPVDCKFCDAGGSYAGRLNYEEIIFQILYPIKRRYNSLRVKTKKFKIQFARMGEPAFNKNVLKVLKELNSLIITNFQIIPSISTVAPENSEDFFYELIKIKKLNYPYNFQLQFSIHSTDENYRNYLIPIKKWSFSKIARYGERFYNPGGRKITLNFALTPEIPVEPHIIAKYFDPEKFIIKITPVNPTFSALKNDIYRKVKDSNEKSINKELSNFFNLLKNDFLSYGFDTIISIGELEENKIGSNCGQFVNSIKKDKKDLELNLQDAYTYNPECIEMSE